MSVIAHYKRFFQTTEQPQAATWPAVDRRHDPRRALDVALERHIAAVHDIDPVVIALRLRVYELETLLRANVGKEDAPRTLPERLAVVQRRIDAACLEARQLLTEVENSARGAG